MLHMLWMTHQPTLNSTWASNRATTGAVAALHPLTLERIRPSCLACRTILMNPGCWLLVSDTKSRSFSFSSSIEHTDKHEFYMNIWRVSEDPVCDIWAKWELLVSKLPPTRRCHVLLQWAVFHWWEAKSTHASLPLITGPKRQQLEPATQTSKGLTSHNGILQYGGLSLQCFLKHERRR